MSATHRWVIRLAILLALPVSLRADTLYLRDGTRIQGELIGVRNGTIEFEERRGFGGGRTLRLDRNEVVRIEFDRNGSNNDSNNNNNNPGGRPSGLRERQVFVAANVGWSDAGIEVRAGQSIYLQASGEVRWGKDRRDGPEGEKNSPPNQNRPMPNRNAAALIGRVGNSNDYFFIGDDSGPIRVRSSGRLYLGVNDDVLTDNSGNFRVVVYY